MCITSCTRTVGFVTCLALAGTWASARGATPHEALGRADALYEAGDLLGAERLYRRVEPRAGGERGHCLDRLLTIYARLGRADLAIQAGRRRRQLLLRGAVSGNRRELDLRLGECFLALGQYQSADKYLGLALAEAGDAPPLPPLRRMAALAGLARSAERHGDRKRANRLWEQVTKCGRAALERRPGLTTAERIECLWQMADSYGARGLPDKAITRLEPLLAVHDRLGDWAGQRDTLRRLVGYRAAQGRHAEAERCLRQALAAHEKTASPDRALRADLAVELAEALARQSKTIDAAAWRDRAARDYAAVLTATGKTRMGSASLVAVFWKAQGLYQRTNQNRKALNLLQTQGERWAGGGLLRARLRSEEGSLQTLVGALARARGLLRDAVAELERQSPADLIQLPRALGNLAVVEQATGALDRAEALADRCLALYRVHALPDDLNVVQAHDVRGACAAERGDYAEAVGRFRAGIECCDRLGRAADVQRSGLLLNLAILHKSQGDLDQALRTCRQAEEKFARFAEPDAPAFAAFAAARASLHAAQGQIREAHALAPRILGLCRKYDISGGPLVTTARHCQGLHHLSRREFVEAAAAWHQVLALQEKERQTLLLPRTLNYLALTEEMRGRTAEAERLYRRALAQQKGNPRAFPVTHFITLWRLAGVADKAGRGAEARRLLEQAVGVVEAARLKTYGDAQQRAAFFAQFDPGFEQLVAACVRAGDVEAALTASARGRSRTLLDELQLAGLDPRQGLQGPRGERLRRQEAELRRRISGLRARAQNIPADDADEGPARRLLAELDETQREYAGVWREVLANSPVYRNLSAQDPAAAVASVLRGRVLGPRDLLLVYHLGTERSYLFLLGGGTRPEAFPLTVPAGAARGPGIADTPRTDTRMVRSRGLQLKPRTPIARGPVPTTSPGDAVPLTRTLARTLIDDSLQALANPDGGGRGLRLTPRGAGGPPAQGLDLLGHVLLPPAVRQRIRARAPQQVVVVPDGPLHKLPLEALVIGPGPRYVLDELPPLVYAPSVAALALLAERQRRAPAGPLSLLTVSNPAYPQAQAVRPAAARGLRSVLGLRGQLPLLPHTAEESRRIRRCFAAGQVTTLEGPRATEQAVVAALAGKRILHLAAHGFADERFGNLFGALALTPPPPDRATPEDDGFLSLHEIYRLPLKDCELAVLSACVTNVGPQRPLEAGVTLAGGFLAAGARRVVASHWSVDDESTAELMATFFEEVAAAARRGERVAYAQALHKARRKVRGTARWSAPFYWAPFVLLGPPGS